MVTWRDKDGVERSDDRRPGGALKRIAATRKGMQRRVRDLAKLHWYAIMVRAGTESAVEALLERRDFLAAVPMRTYFRKVNRHVERKVEVSYPLAARYVFVAFRAEQMERGMPPWGRVFSITMVQSIVGVGEVPWRMDGRRVAEFLVANLNVQPGDGEEHMRTHKEFAVGDMVTVVEGSLAGLTVRVHSISGRDAKVLLPLFGRAEQEFPLRLSDLEPVDE